MSKIIFSKEIDIYTTKNPPSGSTLFAIHSGGGSFSAGSLVQKNSLGEIKEVGGVVTIDLQKTLDVSSNFLFDGKSGGVIGGGDGVDRYTELYYDDLAGRFSRLWVQVNDISIQSEINYGTDYSLFRVVNGIALIQQGNSIGTTTVGFTDPLATTTINFPAKTVNGDYTLATTDDIDLVNLQKVVDTGSTALKGDSTLNLLVDDGLGGHSSEISSSNGNDYSILNIFTENINISSGNSTTNISGEIAIFQGNVAINKTELLSGYSTHIDIETPVTTSILSFPAKEIPGTYTLATTNDIDLQKAIDTNGIASLSNGLGNLSNISVTPEFFVLLNETSEKGGAINLNAGILELSQTDYLNAFSTYVRIDSPVENTTLNFPAKTVAGTYTIATTDDINFQTVVNNGSMATVNYSGFFGVQLEGDTNTITSVSPFGVLVSSGGNTVYYNLSGITYKGKSNFFPDKLNNGSYTIITTPATSYTVSTLPTGELNDIAVVTDSVAPTYLGVLTGGGTVVTPVWHNGTIWVAR